MDELSERKCMENIKKFESETIGNLRTAIDEIGRPVFCLKDACSILEIKNPSDAKTRLKQNGIVKLDSATKGGRQSLLYVTEGNLYRLIFQSRKEEASLFMDWVTDEILPALRKFGRYDVTSIQASSEVALSFLEQYQEMIVKTSILEKIQQECLEARTYIKRCLGSGNLKDLYDVPLLLGIKGVGITELLRILRAKRILQENNLPFEEYIDKGWFRVDTHTYNDKTAGIVSNVRVYCYKTGINNIERILKEYSGGKYV